ncbi:hypothetical protein OH687_07910 [Burkholderia anthina]|nr:hypothetical protein OH687_07910 [Burkholderia anthina]
MPLMYARPRSSVYLSSSVTDFSAASSDARWSASSGAFINCLLHPVWDHQNFGCVGIFWTRLQWPACSPVLRDGSTGANPPPIGRDAGHGRPHVAKQGEIMRYIM